METARNSTSEVDPKSLASRLIMSCHAVPSDLHFINFTCPHSPLVADGRSVRIDVELICDALFECNEINDKTLHNAQIKWQLNTERK